jgi:hypothetical protein
MFASVALWAWLGRVLVFGSHLRFGDSIECNCSLFERFSKEIYRAHLFFKKGTARPCVPQDRIFFCSFVPLFFRTIELIFGHRHRSLMSDADEASDDGCVYAQSQPLSPSDAFIHGGRQYSSSSSFSSPASSQQCAASSQSQPQQSSAPSDATTAALVDWVGHKLKSINAFFDRLSPLLKVDYDTLPKFEVAVVDHLRERIKLTIVAHLNAEDQNAYSLSGDDATADTARVKANVSCRASKLVAKMRHLYDVRDNSGTQEDADQEEGDDDDDDKDPDYDQEEEDRKKRNRAAAAAARKSARDLLLGIDPFLPLSQLRLEFSNSPACFHWSRSKSREEVQEEQREKRSREGRD